jgi:hypothetical protein
MAADPRFDALCRALSGFDDIPARFSASVQQRAGVRFGTDALDQLLATFAQRGLSAVLATEPDAGIAKAILYCLYTGLLPDAAGGEIQASGPTALTVEDFYESLVWRAIQAHPPGLSGGYFGQWHYRPEDP